MKWFIACLLVCLFSSAMAMSEAETLQLGVDHAWVQSAQDVCADSSNACALLASVDNLEALILDDGLASLESASCTPRSCKMTCFPTGGVCTSRGCACF